MSFLLRPICWVHAHRWIAVGVTVINDDGSWMSRVRCLRCGKTALKRYEVKL